MYIATVLIIALLIILLMLNSVIREYIRNNKETLNKLQKTVNSIENKLDKLTDGNMGEEFVSKEKTLPTAELQHDDVITAIEGAPESIEEERPQEPEIEEPEPDVLPLPAVEEEKLEPVAADACQRKEEPKRSKSFSERYPDLEKFIGENLINKIGIVILVLGIGFIVKYAIDQNWINEIGRVAIGIIAAAGLIATAHKLKDNYKSFSSVLIGGGLAVLYFTITYAYYTNGYPFFQQQALTFVILSVITLFAVLLSIAYNRVEIAVLAILGGFASPLMVSNGSGNYIVLFTYLMILNVGMLTLSYYKKWRLVNIISFILTQLFMVGWLISKLSNEEYNNFGGALFYAAGFYIIFFLMNILYNLRYEVEFKVGDIVLLISNTFIYFSVAMLMLHQINDGAYKGIFTILLAVFNFGFAYFIHSRQKADPNLFYLLLGLVLTFITLAIPLQLKGNYITLFWAAESVLFLWLSQKSGFKIMKVSSAVIAVLMTISLIMDWNVYSHGNGSDYHLPVFFNRIVLTTLFAAGAFVALLLMLKKEKDRIIFNIPIENIRFALLTAALFVTYFGILQEVNYQSLHYFIESSSQNAALFTYNALYVLGLLILEKRIKHPIFPKIVIAASTLFLILLPLYLSTNSANNIVDIVEQKETLSILLLSLRWMAVGATYLIGILFIKLSYRLFVGKYGKLHVLSTILCIFNLIYLLSADLDTIGILISGSEESLLFTQKVGYAILWTLSSFALMLWGMKKKIKILRIASLILFAITIIKLFAYDISNISEGGKIIAFTLLGALLLIISFMYQKLKKMVIDDELTKAVQDDDVLNEK